MKSQYLEAYKTETIEEIKKGKKPYSVGTFIVYRLKGRAMNWSSRYINTLKNNLEQEGWTSCKSKLGGIAYQP